MITYPTTKLWWKRKTTTESLDCFNSSMKAMKVKCYWKCTQSMINIMIALPPSVVVYFLQSFKTWTTSNGMCERTWLAHLIAWNDTRSWNVINIRQKKNIQNRDTFAWVWKKWTVTKLLCSFIFNFEWPKLEKKEKEMRLASMVFKSCLCAYIIRLILIWNSFAVIFDINSVTF